MEEASVLAGRVGIMAGKMLTTGTTTQLLAEHATYEVHFSARTDEEVERAQQIMSTIPGSRPATDLATRYEVPMTSDRSLASLFRSLNQTGRAGDFTVEQASLESIFLKVIRKHNVTEELEGVEGRRRWWKMKGGGSEK